jgi:hypothetical protein
MKYLITESKLKEMLRKVAGVDLTGKVDIVTSTYELPMEFDNIMTPTVLRSYLNHYGPMFIIRGPKRTFLYQNQAGRVIIADSRDKTYSETSLMDQLGIPPLGLSVDDIINTYYEE